MSYVMILVWSSGCNSCNMSWGGIARQSPSLSWFTIDSNSVFFLLDWLLMSYLDTHWGSLTPLQRCNQCILLPQSTRQSVN